MKYLKMNFLLFGFIAGMISAIIGMLCLLGGLHLSTFSNTTVSTNFGYICIMLSGFYTAFKSISNILNFKQ